ncbi:MAG: hypothetical protein RL308_2618 [Bacteroidota bacterium]|jgi:hypothetical protein
MNQLTELYRYIKQLAEADSQVNKVTKKQDLAKESIFPLVNVIIESGGFTNGSTVNFNVELSCFDIRNISKEIQTDDFWGNDNEVDNHNLAIAVLNRLWNKMYIDFEENNITASENPAFELGSFEAPKLLDGARLTFSVEVPNTTINLCQ